MVHYLDIRDRDIFLCNIVVFIQGHTKNDTYCLFDLLKGGYYKQDIFTYEELLVILDQIPQVEVTRLNPEIFMDCNSHFISSTKHQTVEV